jgi:hypothetical protein
MNLLENFGQLTTNRSRKRQSIINIIFGYLNEVCQKLHELVIYKALNG